MLKLLRTAAAALALTVAAFVPAQAGDKDIIETAKEAGNLNTFVAAIQAAALEPTLRTPGPFTIFAPTDDAFDALPSGTVDDLLKPENLAQLLGILTLHVLPGKVMASDVDGKTVQSMNVQGTMLTVDGTGGGVKVNDSNVVSADMEATNGVIHTIDAVILP